MFRHIKSESRVVYVDASNPKGWALSPSKWFCIPSHLLPRRRGVCGVALIDSLPCQFHGKKVISLETPNLRIVQKNHRNPRVMWTWRKSGTTIGPGAESDIMCALRRIYDVHPKHLVSDMKWIFGISVKPNDQHHERFPTCFGVGCNKTP